MLPYNTPFMKAIKAAPDDDNPRLFYADWLEENGETEYANFIRLSLMYAKAEAKLGKPPEDELFPETYLSGQRFGFCHELRAFDAIMISPVHDYECPLCLGQRVGRAIEKFPKFPTYFECVSYHRGFIESVALRTTAHYLERLTPILLRNPLQKVTFCMVIGVIWQRPAWGGSMLPIVQSDSEWFAPLCDYLHTPDSTELRFASKEKFDETFSKMILTEVERSI